MYRVHTHTYTRREGKILSKRKNLTFSHYFISVVGQSFRLSFLFYRYPHVILNKKQYQLIEIVTIRRIFIKVTDLNCNIVIYFFLTKLYSRNVSQFLIFVFRELLVRTLRITFFYFYFIHKLKF